MAWSAVARTPGRSFGAGVYALYKNGRLIYIGRAGNLHVRLVDHYRRFRFDYAKVSPCATAPLRRWRERRLLFRLRPAANRIIPAHLAATFYAPKAVR